VSGVGLSRYQGARMGLPDCSCISSSFLTSFCDSLGSCTKGGDQGRDGTMRLAVKGVYDVMMKTGAAFPEYDPQRVDSLEA